jgi:hypothetical protein
VIQDPWRQRKAGTPPKKGEVEGVGDDAGHATNKLGQPGSTHPADWDLMPEKSYLLRVPRATGALVIKGVTGPMAAAALLLRHVRENEQLRGVLERAGIQGRHTVDLSRERGAILQATSDDTPFCLFVPSASTEEGFSKIVRALVIARRDPAFNKLLNALGIEPMLE